MATHRRWFVRPYSGFIGGWLRYGKPLISGISGWLRPKDPVDLNAPLVFSRLRALNPASLGELADWLADHGEWVGDPVGGLLDYFPSAENIEWQLNHGDGVFRDDCDGLAYYTALAVGPFCASPAENYIVTVVYDPSEVPVQGSAHVLHLFRHDGSWRVFSNARLESKGWDTPCEALYDNSYYHGWCRGAELQYVEVRNRALERVAAGLEGCGHLLGCSLEGRG
jgi:hypothetical protein